MINKLLIIILQVGLLLSCSKNQSSKSSKEDNQIISKNEKQYDSLFVKVDTNQGIYNIDGNYHPVNNLYLDKYYITNIFIDTEKESTKDNEPQYSVNSVSIDIEDSVTLQGRSIEFNNYCFERDMLSFSTNDDEFGLIMFLLYFKNQPTADYLYESEDNYVKLCVKSNKIPFTETDIIMYGPD